MAAIVQESRYVKGALASLYLSAVSVPAPHHNGKLQQLHCSRFIACIGTQSPYASTTWWCRGLYSIGAQLTRKFCSPADREQYSTTLHGMQCTRLPSLSKLC